MIGTDYYYTPAPTVRGHYALHLLTVVYPSVRLSVSLCVQCLTLSRKRKGLGSWKLTWRKLSVTPFKGRKVKASGHWPNISHIYGMGSPTSFKLDIRMEYDDPITDMRGDLRAESSGWLFKSLLAGGGHIVSAPHQASQLVLHCRKYMWRNTLTPVPCYWLMKMEYSAYDIVNVYNFGDDFQYSFLLCAVTISPSAIGCVSRSFIHLHCHFRHFNVSETTNDSDVIACRDH